jgi:hypothetical protein
MCLAAGTGAKQSSELRLIGNYFWICWTRPAGGLAGRRGSLRNMSKTQSSTLLIQKSVNLYSYCRAFSAKQKLA